MQPRDQLVQHSLERRALGVRDQNVDVAARSCSPTIRATSHASKIPANADRVRIAHDKHTASQQAFVLVLVNVYQMLEHDAFESHHLSTRYSLLELLCRLTASAIAQQQCIIRGALWPIRRTSKYCNPMSCCLVRSSVCARRSSSVR